MGSVGGSVSEMDLEREHGSRPVGVEGKDDSQWILHDFGDIVLHVFTPEARKLYDLEHLGLSEWRRVMALNVDSVLMGTQAALPLLRASGRPASIVIVSSVAGLIGMIAFYTALSIGPMGIVAPLVLPNRSML